MRRTILKKLGLLLIVAITLLSSNYLILPTNAAVEDFTTYTEVDASGLVTVNATTIQVTGTAGSAWVYKDKGDSHFGTTWTNPILLSFSIQNLPGSNPPDMMLFALANVNNPTKYTNSHMEVAITENTRLYLRILDGTGTQTQDFTGSGFITANVTYNLSINRAGGNFTCAITGGGTDTLIASDPGDLYRYVFPLSAGASALFTSTIWGLNLQEPENPAPTVVTNEATDKTSSSANCSGQVVASTTDITSWGIQFGTSSGSYSSNWTDTGTESAVLDFSHVFDSLSEGNRYFFRAFAVNTGGISYGSEKSFYALTAGAIQTETMTLSPNFETVGVVLDYTGDENNNASVIVQSRIVGGDWVTAPDFWEDTDNSQFKGKIFWLSENTTYQVQATFYDADGIISTNPVTGNTTTLNSNPALGTVHTYHVAKTGNDTTGNGSSGTPWLTIQKAANTVVAGDTVYVHAGTYAEMVTITADGNSSNYITFMPYPGDSVTVTGSSGARQNAFYLNSAAYIRITGFIVIDTGQSGFLLDGSNTDNCIIEYNTITDPTLGSTTGIQGGIRFSQGTDHLLLQYNNITCANTNTNTTAITYWYPGNSNVIRNNTIQGVAAHLKDGIGGGPENTDFYTDNWDIYENVINTVSDDGIQIEGSDINSAIWSNTISNCFIGVGFCPNNIGPLFVFRNVVINNSVSGSAAYKLGDGSYGRTYFYHNTSFTDGLQDGLKQTNPGLGNVVSRNNIVYSGRYIFEFAPGVPPNMDMDYDYLYTTDPTRFVKWSGTSQSDTFVKFKASTGQELNAISSADPGFTDSATDNLTLLETSVCVDAGTVLVGFNDSNSPWPYQGDAPDIGAYEYDSQPVVAPTVQTDAVSSIGSTTATLNGQVLDNGWGATSCYFYIDTSEPDSDSTNISMGTQTGIFSYDITDLLSDTLYYVNVYGINSAGDDWGVSVNFTTLAEGVISLPTLGAFTIINVTTTTFTVSGSLSNSGGEDCDINIYTGEFDGVQDSDSWSNNSTPTSPSQPQGIGTFYLNVTGWGSATNIYANVSANNSAGTTWGTTIILVTKPEAPTLLTASNGTSTENITLNWTNPSGNITNIYILQDSITIDVIAGTETSYTVTSSDASIPIITPGFTVASDGTSNTTVTISLSSYSIADVSANYTVEAFNAGGYSDESNQDEGYIGHGTLVTQLRRSAADSDASYGDVAGAISTPYNDILGVANTGRWYQWLLTADGAEPEYSISNRGYTAANPAPVVPSTSSAATIFLRIALPIVIAIGIVVVAVGLISGNVITALIGILIGITGYIAISSILAIL